MWCGSVRALNMKCFRYCAAGSERGVLMGLDVSLVIRVEVANRTGGSLSPGARANNHVY